MRNWPPTAWVVTDGKAGMENQCLGLAEAMGVVPVVKRIRLRKLWRELSPYVTAFKNIALSRKGDALVAPWPDMVIGTGRMSVLPSLFIKKASHGKTFTVQIQNPAVPFQKFDQVILPVHDGVKAPNILSVTGGLHRVEPQMLAREGAKWAPVFAHLPRPYTAVLLGGNNSSYRLTPREVMEFGPRLAAIAKEQKTSLLITPSRRTPESCMALLRILLHDIPAFIWDGQGDNPYYGMLALADNFVVTCDSVNMVSEACATGKPVHVVKLPGYSPKFSAFHQSLLETNRIRWFEGRLENWSYEPLAEMPRVAALIKEAYLHSDEQVLREAV
jgi:mitochondrial fission protein ELM1